MVSPYRPFDVRLNGRRTLSPSFVRLTLSGADLHQCSPTLLDQRIKLLLGASAQLDPILDGDWFGTWQSMTDQPAMRTYTLAAVRAEVGEVDIDVVLHPASGGEPAGPATEFAAHAPLGSRLLLVVADRRISGHDEVGVAYHPGPASRVILVADETALPAVQNILDAARPGVRYELYAEVPQAGDVRELHCAHAVWSVRARGQSLLESLPFGRDAGPVASTGPDRVDDATETGSLLWEETADARGGRYLWAAGEAGLIRSIRRSAREAGFEKSECSFMGYWRRGAAQI